MNHHDTTDTKKTGPAPISGEIDNVARIVLDAAFAVHRTLGPGLLESVYEACLAIELRHLGMPHARQVSVPINYREQKVEPALRLDFLVADLVVIEVKAVERLLPVHDAQVLTYLRLCGKRLGLPINFNVTLLRDGIKRIAL